MGSGAQNPPGHEASCDCCAGGTSDDGTQWAPLHAGLHAGKMPGSTTAGPVHGQVRMAGGFAGSSHAIEHAPVAAVGSAAVGLKHGAQRSSVAQVPCGSTSRFAATNG